MELENKKKENEFDFMSPSDINKIKNNINNTKNEGKK